jgi:uncharacterized membrane protein
MVVTRLPGWEEHVSVFMLCTPNPATRFFLYVARSAVIERDFPVEAAAKLIMSAGLIQSRNGDSAKKLVERVNQIEGAARRSPS